MLGRNLKIPSSTLRVHFCSKLQTGRTNAVFCKVYCGLTPLKSDHRRIDELKLKAVHDKHEYFLCSRLSIYICQTDGCVLGGSLLKGGLCHSGWHGHYPSVKKTNNERAGGERPGQNMGFGIRGVPSPIHGRVF